MGVEYALILNEEFALDILIYGIYTKWNFVFFILTEKKWHNANSIHFEAEYRARFHAQAIV